MAEQNEAVAKRYCCSSRQTMCFWGCAFAVFYVIGMATIYWLDLPRYGLTALFAALGLACLVNLARNRTFHCVITAPFFLLVAIVFALNTGGIWKIQTEAVWTIVVIVVCAALLLEGRYAS